MGVTWGGAVVTSLEPFLKSPWFKPRAEEPDSKQEWPQDGETGLLQCLGHKVPEASSAGASRPHGAGCLSLQVPGDTEKGESREGGRNKRGAAFRSRVLERKRGAR